MPTKIELREMAKTRLKEAKVLYDNGLYDGACYLAGYVIELALKARICKLLDINDYPPNGDISRAYKIHDLDQLLRLAGLENKFNTAKLANPNLLANWSLISLWNEQYRYRPIGTSIKVNTEHIINALEDSTDGVLTWIKSRW
jgi:HEPN domain-containing protein